MSLLLSCEHCGTTCAGFMVNLRADGQARFKIFVFILPMWMNFLLRTMAWQVLLGDRE